jgi:hypothetical protein
LPTFFFGFLGQTISNISSGALRKRTLISQSPVFSTWKCGGRWSSELNHRSRPGSVKAVTFATGEA